jgi:hypothetical protein
VTVVPINLTSIAENAARSFVRQTLVLLFEPPFEKPAGSGTLVRTINGCAVLTCKHVLESDWSRMTVEHRSGIEMHRAIDSVELHGKHDVAIARLRDPRALEPYAISPSRIAKADAFPISTRAPALVAGFPIQEMRESRDEAGRLVRGIGDISYLTTIAGSHRDALSVDWDVSEPNADDDWNWEEKGSPSDHRKFLKKPLGLSGGGVWTFEPMYAGTGAEPRISTMIGVPFKHTNKRQLAVPANLWRRWLLDALVRTPANS